MEEEEEEDEDEDEDEDEESGDDSMMAVSVAGIESGERVLATCAAEGGSGGSRVSCGSTESSSGGSTSSSGSTGSSDPPHSSDPNAYLTIVLDQKGKK